MTKAINFDHMENKKRREMISPQEWKAVNIPEYCRNFYKINFIKFL